MKRHARSRAVLIGVAAVAVQFAVASAACRRDVGGTAPAELERIGPLPGDLPVAAVRFEETRRRETADYRHPPDARHVLGPDPIAISPTADGGAVVLVTQPPALVVVDRELRERSRVLLAYAGSALAWAGDGLDNTLLVASRSSRSLEAFRWREGSIERLAERDVPDLAKRGVRDFVASGACIYGVDQDASELVWRCEPSKRGATSVPRGPVHVVATASHVIVTSPIGHEVTVFETAPDGVPRPETRTPIANDGPLFTAEAIEDETGAVYVASGGVENHPLDRRGGSFGFVDPYLFVDRIALGAAQRIATLNLGELGVVTPKAIAIERSGPTALGIRVAGYGSEKAAAITIALEGNAESKSAPKTHEIASLPGIVRFARAADGSLLAPSPLLDGIVVMSGDGTAPPRFVAIDGAVVANDPLAPDEPALRLGEALFYTTAMGPWQRTEGPLSRFTCETCHFEGGGDGRIHATGRGDILATTKPLLGLANNGPHFTRALDRDLAQMVFAEFRVAAANSGHDEWFDLDDAGLRWTSLVPWYARARHGPISLRRALMLYLASLPHPARPSGSARRPAFEPAERRGAALFEQRCVSCHAARLVTSDPTSTVPSKEWEALVLSDEAPIVWARDGYERTGVEPYVHPDGARPSSLRRIADKTPYFTNGAARSLEDVVRAARWDNAGFHHIGGADADRFDEAQVTDLVAFLLLL